jgi:hypothetical protein
MHSNILQNISLFWKGYNDGLKLFSQYALQQYSCRRVVFMYLQFESETSLSALNELLLFVETFLDHS